VAGDWIKLETATPYKPEVLRIAEMLGVPRQHAFGIIAEFWCWLDQNCSNGSVTHLSLLSIDAVTHCPGFAASLADVGWGKIDLSTGILTIKNFDRHNGSSAKSRALNKNRAQRHRNAPLVTKALPEKRREEVVQPSVVSNSHPDAGTSKKVNNASDSHPKGDKKSATRWDASDQGIEAKGRELGVIAKPGETYFDFKQRLWGLINEQKRGAAA
jgi:hypothetical protein